MTEEKRDSMGNIVYRDQLSKHVVMMSIGGVFFLAFAVIFYSWLNIKDSTDQTQTIQMVFTAVLPLFGAWVGTILAFYYGRENFEASTRSFTKIAESVGGIEKLKEIEVSTKMIAKKDMIFDNASVDKIKLTEIIKKLSEKERLPILNDKGAIIYMIHRSYIDRYMTQKALESPPPNLKDLTLKDLLEGDSKLKDVFEHSFGFVKEGATLADAKTEMERLPKCQDVFVTKTGSKDDPVVGWITNTIIQEAGKL
jgi:hypothetical protein